MKSKTKKITKAQAIKINCRECAGGSFEEALLCHLFDCPFWTWRTGYMVKKNEKSLKAYLAKHPEVAKEYEEVVKLRENEVRDDNQDHGFTFVARTGAYYSEERRKTNG